MNNNDELTDAFRNLESRLIDLEAKAQGDWRPPNVTNMIYFRDKRERHLRRDILDKFTSGEDVDMSELRSAVAALVNRHCELGDALVYWQKKEIVDRRPIPPSPKYPPPSPKYPPRPPKYPPRPHRSTTG